jgi:transcriptional regulator of acetoin/glycerol metabolism
MPENWKRELHALPFDAPARYAIVESWTRCAHACLERAGQPDFHKVSDEELELRQKNAAALIELARPRLEELLHRVPGATKVAYVTDGDGVVLASAGAADQIAAFGLAPGYDWSERRMGTNGAGTAITTRAAVAVVGDEHFHTAFADFTCTAAPIYGHDRSIAGALDVSSSAAEARPERLAQVIQAADEISLELYRRWRRTIA